MTYTFNGFVKQRESILNTDKYYAMMKAMNINVFSDDASAFHFYKIVIKCS